MTPRSHWNGLLIIAAVCLEVRLYKATSPAPCIRLTSLDPETGAPPVAKTSAVQASAGAAPAAKPETHKSQDVAAAPASPPIRLVPGFESEPGKFVRLEQAELDAIAPDDTDKAIDIRAFVDPSEVHPQFFEDSFYVAPGRPIDAEAFVVLRDAMRRMDRAGLGRMVMAGNEYHVLLRQFGDGMMLTRLRCVAAVRDAVPCWGDGVKAKAPPALVALARTLMSQRQAPFDPTDLIDWHQARLLALVQAKIKNRRPPSRKPRPKHEAIDLAQALKASVAPARA